MHVDRLMNTTNDTEHMDRAQVAGFYLFGQVENPRIDNHCLNAHVDESKFGI